MVIEKDEKVIPRYPEPDKRNMPKIITRKMWLIVFVVSVLLALFCALLGMFGLVIMLFLLSLGSGYVYMNWDLYEKMK